MKREYQTGISEPKKIIKIILIPIKLNENARNNKNIQDNARVDRDNLIHTYFQRPGKKLLSLK